MKLCWLQIKVPFLYTSSFVSRIFLRNLHFPIILWWCRTWSSIVCDNENISIIFFSFCVIPTLICFSFQIVLNFKYCDTKWWHLSINIFQLFYRSHLKVEIVYPPRPRQRNSHALLCTRYHLFYTVNIAGKNKHISPLVSYPFPLIVERMYYSRSLRVYLIHAHIFI